MEHRYRTMLILMLVGAMVTLAPACPGTDDDDDDDDVADDDDDSGGPSTVELTGVVIDPVPAAEGEPVEGAWVVVDTGDDELFTTTSDADGRFVFDAPEEGVFTVTVGKDDYATRTVTETLASIPEPESDVLYSLSKVHADDYPSVDVYVHGTISGAPVNSRIYFYGNDQQGYSGFSVPTEDPVEYDFTTVARGGQQSLTFSVIALDAYPNQVAVAGTVVEVPVQADVLLDVTIPDTAPSMLTLTTNRPMMNGEEFGTIGEDNAYQGGMTYFSHRSRSITGFAQTWEDVGDGYEFTIPCFPQADQDNGVQAYLFDGWSGHPIAMAYIPIGVGTESVDVELLDTAEVQAGATFSESSPLAFEPASGADSHQLMVLNINGETKWIIDTTQSEFAFPRMPDPAPGDLVTGSPLSWYLLSVDNGGLPRDELFHYQTEYRSSYVPGSSVEP